MKLSYQPSRQGDLDCLCGIYALVNAVSYLHPVGIRRTSLTLALIDAFSEKWPVQSLITEGMGDECLSYLIEQVLKNGYYARYPISFTKPFNGVSSLRISGVLDQIQAYLARAEGSNSRLVLLATRDHWTLAYRVDDTAIYLIDSTGMKKAYRRSFALRSGNATHVLVASETYFLERIEGGRP